MNLTENVTKRQSKNTKQKGAFVRRKNIIISCLALTFSICLMVFGVYAAINPKVSVSGQVTYQVRDAKIIVQGKVNGALDSNGVAINGEYADPEVDASDYTSIEPITDQQAKYLDYTVGTGTNIADDDLTEWEIGDLSFSESSAGVADITISFKLTNFSLYPVKATLSYGSGSLNNVTRTETKTHCTLNPTGQDGDNDEIVVILSVGDESEDAPNTNININITFEKATVEDGNEQQPDPILENWSGKFDSDLEGIVLTSYSGMESNIVIPSAIDTAKLEEYNGVSQLSSNVKGLVSNQYSSNILKVVGLEANLNTSEPKPLVENNFHSITSIYIPNTIKYIGAATFALTGCINANDVMMGNGEPNYSQTDIPVIFQSGSNLNSLGGGAFAYSGISSINLPNGITRLESVNINGAILGVFHGCTKLQNVEIPDSVTVVDRYVLNGCSSLTDLVIGSEVETIEDYAFQDCTSLETLTIPENVKDLGYRSFSGCVNLSKIYFNAVEMNACGDFSNSTAKACFYKAGKNTEGIEVVFGKNVKKVPIGLFACIEDSSQEDIMANSPKVTKVRFEEGSVCTSIGDGAFVWCASLLDIEIPQNLKDIGMVAFAYCVSMRSIDFKAIQMNDLTIDHMSFVLAGLMSDGITFTVDKSVKKIPAYLFAASSQDYGSNVTEINFEQGSECDTIGDMAFVFTKISQITINENMKTFGFVPFGQCTNLEKVYYNAIEATGTAFTYVSNENLTIYIGNKVKAIPENFCTSSSVNEIVFEENSVCEDIKERAFESCENLTKINIPYSVKNIGFKAFHNCKKLESVDLSDNLEYIGERAFASCEKIQTITLGTGIKNIEYSAFENCLALSTVYYNTVELQDLMGSIFYYGDTQVNVIIAPNVKRIPESLFWFCNIVEITIPDSVETIGKRAFYNCKSLTNITFGSGLKQIGQWAFDSCTSLENITIPDNVTTIINEAFIASNLKSVVIGSGVQTIEDGAFNCDLLTSVYYHGSEDYKNKTLTTLGTYNFLNATWYYFDETESKVGNYWHYGDNGEIVVQTAG